MVNSTVSKILQNHYLAQTTSKALGEPPGLPTEQTPEQHASNTDAVIEWARAAQRTGTHVSRDMLRRQAAIFAAADWKSPSSADPGAATHMLTEEESIPPLNPPTMTSPSIPMGWSDLGAMVEGAITDSSSSTTSGESCIPDLLSLYASGAIGGPEPSQIDGHGTSDSPDHCHPSSVNGDLSTATLGVRSITGASNTSWAPGTSESAAQVQTYAAPPTNQRGYHQALDSLTGWGKIPGHQLYEEGLVSSHSATDRLCDTDRVCLHEARRALSTIEDYLASLREPTALDVLCLNHVRSRLGK